MTSVFYLSRITPNIINNIKMWWLSRWPFEPHHHRRRRLSRRSRRLVPLLDTVVPE